MPKHQHSAGVSLAAALGFAALAMFQATPAAAQPPPAAQGGAPPRGLPDPYVGKKKLLVIADVQSGFHHDSINHAMAVIETLGRDSGAYVSFLRTDSQLITKQPILGRGTRYSGRGINAKNLDYFDAVFFLGSGEGTLTAEQKRDLLAFVRDDGKGFVGGHASIIGYYDWPEFGEMMGGVMKSEYPVTPMPIVVADPKFPGADAFAGVTTYADQFPVLTESFKPGQVHTIIGLDASRLSDADKARGRADGYLPIVWAKPYGKGRVFYSSFGHLDAPWDDPKVQKLYLEAIKWALGVTPAAVPLDAPTK